MNYHLATQIINMKAIAKTFEESCELAALREDGKISPDEEKILKRINTATRRFIKELDKLQYKEP